jgi:hypothetical protein
MTAARQRHPAIFRALAARERPSPLVASVEDQEPDNGWCDCGREKSTLQDACDECLNYQGDVEAERHRGIFVR